MPQGSWPNCRQSAPKHWHWSTIPVTKNGEVEEVGGGGEEKGSSQTSRPTRFSSSIRTRRQSTPRPLLYHGVSPRYRLVLLPVCTYMYERHRSTHSPTTHTTTSPQPSIPPTLNLAQGLHLRRRSTGGAIANNPSPGPSSSGPPSPPSWPPWMPHPCQPCLSRYRSWVLFLEVNQQGGMMTRQDKCLLSSHNRS
jgi:hypothetical protein